MSAQPVAQGAIAGGVLRFGVAVEDAVVPRWAAACIRQLLAAKSVELVLVIDVRPDIARTQSPLRRRLARLNNDWLKLWIPELRDVAWRDMMGGVPVVHCRAGSDAAGAIKLEGSELPLVAGAELDVVLDLSGGLIAGAMPPLARLGTWIFDYDRDRCRSPFLGEVLARDQVVRVQLLQYANGREFTVALYEGYFGLQRSYSRTVGAVLRGVANWCTRACCAAQLGVIPNARSAIPPSARPSGIAFAAAVRYLMHVATLYARGAVRRLLLVEDWNLAVVERPIKEILRTGHTGPAQWLPLPRRFRFYADPFALRRGDKLYILFEEFDHHVGKGRISSVALKPNGNGISPRTVFDATEHLSYPFLFEDGPNVYCVPEMAEAGKVVLYRALHFPDVWEQAAVLIEHFPALDSTIFRHDGLWWLLCASAEADNREKLFAWYAAALTGPWCPHALNPVKCDVRASRPAGTPFVVDGTLYRPAQDCSAAYGGAVTLNQIRVLSPTRFEEEAVTTISPDPQGPYPAGLHTICVLGDITLIDGKRYYLSFLAFPLRLLAQLRKRGLLSLERRQIPMKLPLGGAGRDG